MTITLITAGVLGLWLLVLSFNVVRHRGRQKVNLGSGEDNSPLFRAVRAQGNFVEYSPLMLILLASMETMHAHTLLLMILAASFSVGRLLHGYGLGFTDGSVSFWRMTGTLLTWVALLAASIAALIIGLGV